MKLTYKELEKKRGKQLAQALRETKALRDQHILNMGFSTC